MREDTWPYAYNPWLDAREDAAAVMRSLPLPRKPFTRRALKKGR